MLLLWRLLEAHGGNRRRCSPSIHDGRKIQLADGFLLREIRRRRRRSRSIPLLHRSCRIGGSRIERRRPPKTALSRFRSRRRQPSSPSPSQISTNSPPSDQAAKAGRSPKKVGVSNALQRRDVEGGGEWESMDRDPPRGQRRGRARGLLFGCGKFSSTGGGEDERRKLNSFSLSSQLRNQIPIFDGQIKV